LSGVAPDGSPVDVYRALPLAGEDELVAAVVSPPASVLDLGSGPGRIANALAQRGYDVVAVDESDEMLRHVKSAATVLADVVALRLGRVFDCVLLASHFVNDADDERRRALLRTCAVHLDVAGTFLAEAYPPTLDWEKAVGRTTRMGDVAVRVEAARRAGALVEAVVAYELGDNVWRQPFTAVMLDEHDLHRELESAGLEFERWLDPEGGWFTAARAATTPGTIP
jgi:SAM-dependent methyltransferase